MTTCSTTPNLSLGWFRKLYVLFGWRTNIKYFALSSISAEVANFFSGWHWGMGGGSCRKWNHSCLQDLTTMSVTVPALGHDHGFFWGIGDNWSLASILPAAILGQTVAWVCTLQSPGKFKHLVLFGPPNWTAAFSELPGDSRRQWDWAARWTQRQVTGRKDTGFSSLSFVLITSSVWNKDSGSPLLEKNLALSCLGN